MIFNDKISFDEFILDSFSDGVFVCELRLSESERVYLQENFINASIFPMPDDTLSDKKWYRIQIFP